MSTEPQPKDLISEACLPVAELAYRVTAADAKEKAVSDLTAACYQKASELRLTKEETDALKSDFPDESFQPGAAGKENLIYIEHASLRERLDSVIGMGQWVMIPIRRWVEDFEYDKDVWVNNRRTDQIVKVTGKHVYVDAILLIRGCFVASAIGEMTYYPENHTQNYGDAVEGAETAALRRCCKRLGVGLQAWRKDWCADWWIRRKAPKPAKQPAKAPQSAKHTEATDKTRLWALNFLKAAPGQPCYELVSDFLLHRKWSVTDALTWKLEHVPISKEAVNDLWGDIQQWDIARHAEANPE